MEITLLAFGIVKDIFKSHSIKMELPEGATTADLKALLNSKHPELHQLTTYMIAVNNEYSPQNEVIHEGDEIAIIPPVSGG